MQDEEKRIEEQFESLVKTSKKEQYILKLYVAGLSSRSRRAIATIRDVCETHLQGRYALQVIDLYQQPTLAKGEQIIAAPTLIKKLPLPLRKIIGDMTNQEKVLVGLDLVKREETI
jgi:circadian clock protein KaiB